MMRRQGSRSKRLNRTSPTPAGSALATPTPYGKGRERAFRPARGPSRPCLVRRSLQHVVERLDVAVDRAFVGSTFDGPTRCVEDADRHVGGAVAELRARDRARDPVVALR